MTDPTETQLREAGRKLSAEDYSGTVRSYFPYWDALIRPFLLRVIQALPADRFDFKPRPELLTAHQLALHIAEAERGWIFNVLEGGPYEEWIVPHHDPSQGWVTVYDAPDHTSLLAALETWHRHTQKWLDRPASEIGRVIVRRVGEGPEQRFTLHRILARLEEHEIHHRAQLNLYLRLMGVEPPAI